MAGQWYELRVTGSAGTTRGLEAGMSEGKAVGEAGRLVAPFSGQARRFATPNEAQDFPGLSTIGPIYNFEVVCCTETSAAPIQPQPIYSRGW